MNITREAEAQLLQQYAPLIRNQVARLCHQLQKPESYRDDLLQEASLAFIEHLRQMQSMDQIPLCKTPIRRAMYRFLEAMSPVHIPHCKYYSDREKISVISLDLNDETLRLLPATDPTEVERICTLRDFIGCLDPRDRKMIYLRANGYTDREIVRMLGYSSVWQLMRCLKRIQKQYIDCFDDSGGPHGKC